MTNTTDTDLAKENAEWRARFEKVCLENAALRLDVMRLERALQLIRQWVQKPRNAGTVDQLLNHVGF